MLKSCQGERVERSSLRLLNERISHAVRRLTTPLGSVLVIDRVHQTALAGCSL